jgi:hypothetical protein
MNARLDSMVKGRLIGLGDNWSISPIGACKKEIKSADRTRLVPFFRPACDKLVDLFDDWAMWLAT